MSVNDPIADMLTRIRNAAHAHHDAVTIPYSRIKEAIARVLASEGFIKDVSVGGEGVRRALVVALKYVGSGRPVFQHLQRNSKLGRRVYVGAQKIRPSRQGMGVSILTTSKGVMKEMDAKKQNVGGEVLCIVW
jgi:small subunit ribosomal protein S8